MVVDEVRGKQPGAVEAAAVLLGSFREAAFVTADLPALAEQLVRSWDRHGPQGRAAGNVGRRDSVDAVR
ncbi:hypothetical protein [Streptomyces sp. NPDC059819]|uniref:hypothetical protein n=1 Tax=Streptomyces sp. NPDC059819 TaxID=3346963 RepID=UPI00364C1A6E